MLLVQVQATLGALWEAFEDIAVYMEVLKVQILVEAPRGERLLLRHAFEVWQDVSRQCCRRRFFSADGRGACHASQVAATGYYPACSNMHCVAS